MSDELYRMVYASKSVRPMTRGELDDMLQGSRARNSKTGVSGLLLYDGGNFLQVLEGPRETLEGLYDSIAQDPRHHSVERIAAGPIAQRDFKDWAMGFADLALFKDFDVSELRAKLAGTDPLEPRATYSMLLEFRDSLR